MIGDIQLPLDLGRKPVRIPDNGRPALISGYEYNGSPIYLSEFGGIAFIPPGHDVPQEMSSAADVVKRLYDREYLRDALSGWPWWSGGYSGSGGYDSSGGSYGDSG